jgi:stage III sporulation protein SpoIIIAA
VGRNVTGNATMIADLLLGRDSNSILFLGEPGSGKTTIIQEVIRLLTEHTNTCIVDTSNKIAGDGNIPHPCVGHARRMMVRSLNDQANVMIECVQNHTPSVMVIDEIGRSTEVEAARTYKERGVQIVASAHGDFKKLIKNPKLCGLVGGIETVTLGDDLAKKENQKSDGTFSKLKSQRAGNPVFEIVVELQWGVHHEQCIIMDSGDVVDMHLDCQEYPVEIRTQNPYTGAIQIGMS